MTDNNMTTIPSTSNAQGGHHVVWPTAASDRIPGLPLVIRPDYVARDGSLIQTDYYGNTFVIFHGVPDYLPTEISVSNVADDGLVVFDDMADFNGMAVSDRDSVFVGLDGHPYVVNYNVWMSAEYGVRPVWSVDLYEIKSPTTEPATRYVATINVPGYLPTGGDEPAVFDSAQEAWEYLADERERGEDNSPEWVDGNWSGEYTATRETLAVLGTAAHWQGEMSEWLAEHGLAADGTGTVHGATPGYDGDHDLGLSYSVSVAETDDAETDDDDDDDEPLSWDEVYERYDDMIDEIDGPVTIGELTYQPSRVLREIDPTAYRCGFNDWADSEGIDTDELTGNADRH
ncbi:MAG TPA: hypothetical protein VK735_39560 [Pseudonocardia sp.]|uniref:hypothetical protein n=1 Tax=Pseudonocardia sp. TaxID=60912 RepID=UPI002BDA1346|nr:hypothetical protein [Pseudonocardia sp.]HTF53580.1 hypothetical protein [Pseudonocardia sp.]